MGPVPPCQGPVPRAFLLQCSFCTGALADTSSMHLMHCVCFCLSVVAPPRHESPEYFTRGRRSCPADGLGVRVQFLLTYEIESESGLTPGLDLVGKPAASAAEPTGNYIYIVLTPCGFGVQVHIEASRARTAARA
uniref:Uncharacterized protein n=1 Tax=Ananas comosus var. bracteatus TaxID=296719 RepID=A0A6V7Q3E8_ANACO|nr:unnamed protein product [Ananas comosus var. bracteatus]